jgi:hypothetical protein
MSPALLIKHVRAHIARETESELDDVVIVTAAEQVDAIPMTPHAALAVQRILAGEVDPA